MPLSLAIPDAAGAGFLQIFPGDVLSLCGCQRVTVQIRPKHLLLRL